MNDPKKMPKYTSSEVASLLSRASAPRASAAPTSVRRSGRPMDGGDDGEGRISHEELLETAREIGITTGEMEAAVAAEVKQRADKAAAHARRRRVFFGHAAAYVVVNALLFAVDWKLTAGVWFYWVLLGWGVALALHAARAFTQPREARSSREADTLPGVPRLPEASGSRPIQRRDDKAPPRRSG